jgi:hypothetical protein
MIRPSRESLIAATSIAEKWLYKCNGKPAQGMLVGAANLRVVLATTSENIGVYPNGKIEWTAAARTFTAEPVRDEPLADMELPVATGPTDQEQP